MRILLRAAVVVLLMSATMAYAGSFTIGNADLGNCLPFMCNFSGTNAGQTILFQQAYRSGAFPGAAGIQSVGFGYWPYLPYSRQAVVLGGTYDFYLGYSADGMALNAPVNSSSNYAGPPTFWGQMTVPAGGTNFGSMLTFTGISPFNYNPALGDLLLTVVAYGQDNSYGEGYNWCDQEGTDVVRALSITNAGSSGAGISALDTTFNTTNVTPEPGSLLLLGTGLAGLAGAIRRRLAQN